jgi:hypothetical protein
MSHYHIQKFSDRPFNSCDKFIIPLLNVKIRGTPCPDWRKIGSAAGHNIRKAALTQCCGSGSARIRNFFFGSGSVTQGFVSGSKTGLLS